MIDKKFKLESELCDEFMRNNSEHWDIYPECFGFDMYLFKKDEDIQIGIEAKLQANLKVIYQILNNTEYENHKYIKCGPHYRAILVPECNIEYKRLCHKLNIMTFGPETKLVWQYNHINLDRSFHKVYDNYELLPCVKRHVRPKIALQSSAGCKSPHKMSKWRIKALKLMIKYKNQGYILSTDIKELGLDITRMTNIWFEYQYRESKIGRCYKMVLKDENHSPATNYEKELEELRNNLISD